jgi:hypothetical protein
MARLQAQEPQVASPLQERAEEESAGAEPDKAAELGLRKLEAVAGKTDLSQAAAKMQSPRRWSY